ncbi:MAG: hypothetical protein JXR77_19560 [Lentisphaeria bacterium]|nr:hypothetical protein [Lentisphaeria bacterium]
MERQHDFVGIGFGGLDTLCILPHIPMDEKVAIRRLLIQGGGPAATATVTAARLGLRTAFVGAVGDDEAGRAILREFALEGVDTGGVVCRSGAASPAAYCWVEESTGRRSIAWTSGSAAPVRVEELAVDLVRGAGVVHLDGHQTEAALRAAEIARGAGIPVFLDAGSLLPRVDEVLARCDVAIASESFARRFTGEGAPEDAVRALRERGPRWTGVTLGAAGSIAFDGARLLRMESFPVAVVDTTGAGDVYHGAFAARFLSLWHGAREWPDLGECMRFAAAVAALKCRAFGGRSGIPASKEAVAFLATCPNRRPVPQ